MSRATNTWSRAAESGGNSGEPSRSSERTSVIDGMSTVHRRILGIAAEKEEARFSAVADRNAIDDLVVGDAEPPGQSCRPHREHIGTNDGDKPVVVSKIEIELRRNEPSQNVRGDRVI